MQEGTNSGTGVTGTPTVNGSTTGVQQDLIQTAGATSGNGRLIIWSKILVSGDTTSNVQVSLTGFTVHRFQPYIIPATEGWDGSRVAQAIQSSTNGTASLSWTTNPARRCVAIAGGSFVSVSAGLQYTYDGGAARDPYCDESSSTTTDGAHGHHYGTTNTNTSSDWNGYDIADTPASVAWSAGTGNSTHSIGAVLYQTAPPPTELGPAKANAAYSAKASLLGVILLSGKSSAALSAKAVFGAPIRLTASTPAAMAATATLPNPHLPDAASALATSANALLHGAALELGTSKASSVFDAGAAALFLPITVGPAKAGAALSAKATLGSARTLTGKANVAMAAKAALYNPGPTWSSTSSLAMSATATLTPSIHPRDVRFSAGAPLRSWWSAGVPLRTV